MAWLLATLLTPAAALSQAALPTQTLPIRAQVCGPVLGERQHQPPASTCVALEVPDTPQEYSIGLMGRSRLLPERGMWFRFDQQEAGFWMRNVLIPLDLVFLERYDPHSHGNGNDDPAGMLPTARIVKVAHDVPPAGPCRAPPTGPDNPLTTWWSWLQGRSGGVTGRRGPWWISGGCRMSVGRTTAHNQHGIE